MNQRDRVLVPVEACSLTREAGINEYTGRRELTDCEKYAGKIVYIETVTIGGCSSLRFKIRMSPTEREIFG